MRVCYVDETGTDGLSPFVVMVGIVVDASRLGRTTEEFKKISARLVTASTATTLKEIKSVDLYRGKNAWRGVDGELRHQIIGDLCDWLSERKHRLALAAADVAHVKMLASGPENPFQP